MEDILSDILKAIDEAFGTPGRVMVNILLLMFALVLFTGALWFTIDFSRRIANWLSSWASPLWRRLGLSVYSQKAVSNIRLERVLGHFGLVTSWQQYYSVFSSGLSEQFMCHWKLQLTTRLLLG